MNVVNLIGRITAEPSLKQTQNGNNYCTFSLAVERRVKERTVDFISCIAYKQTAETICKYVHKGNNLGISGALNVNGYEKDGEKRQSWIVVVNQIDFLSPKQESSAPKEEQTAQEPSGELPFDI